ncbi:hypothetical protein OAC71_00095 [Candidatus Thioglobus sp.]|nr:hypothetical protein [Candidatus Thioglobus sp.]
MNKFQLQRLYESDLVQFAIKVLIISIGVIFTAFMIDAFNIEWMQMDLDGYAYIDKFEM